MRLLVVALGLSLLPATPQKEDTNELLDGARRALGGVEKLGSLKSLSATGSVRRVVRERETKGDFEIHFILPDRFMKREKSKVLGRAITLITVLNKSEAWMDMEPRPGRADLMGEHATFSEGPEPVEVSFARAEFARLMLGLLLALPPSMHGEFARGSPDLTFYGRPVDVVEVSGADGFEVTLYLDRESHRPVKLDYIGMPAAGASPLAAPSGGLAGLFRRGMPPPSSSEDTVASVEMVIQERFSDYLPVDGILIPHRITKLADQKVFEELKLKTVTIDPPLDPKTFERRGPASR